MESLVEISSRYETDKAGFTHYLANYEGWFGPLREKDIVPLELGILDGGSLKLWRDYFPNGRIVGLDLNPISIDDPSGRINVYACEQQDRILLDRIAAETAPGGFDIIIDDCSHIASLARASFRHLFDNYLKSGGFYVIEDWGTGYWDGWPDGARFRKRRHQAEETLPDKVAYKLASVLRTHPHSWFSPLISALKHPLVKRTTSSHNAGMVGLIKEMVDECALADIHHPEFGSPGQPITLIKELVILQSHILIVKK
jgi:hypothetical protein